MTSLERIADALERIANVIEGLEAKQRPARKPLTPADALHLAELLPAAFERVKGQPWKVGDLTRGAERFNPRHRALVLAIDAIPGSLGKFLARCEGHEAGGFRLEPVPNHGNQRVWRIRPVGSKPPLTSPGRP